MEKGFNDDELADIMNEIESLEKEFTEEIQASDAVMEEVQAGEVSAEPQVEEVVAQPQVEEVVAQPQVEEVVAQPQVEEAVAEPQVEEVVAQPQVEEAVAEPQVEEVVAQSQVEEAVAEPQVEEVVAQSHPEVEEEKFVQPEADEVESVAEVATMEVQDVVEKHQPQDDHNVHKIEQHNSPVQHASSPSFGHSAMNFHVEGNMKLDLSFNISGKSVSLNITEHGFELVMDNGMKFSIPLDHEDSTKKAA